MLNPTWIAIGDAIDFLRDQGSSIVLGYDSDYGFWSVEWITGGIRYTANGSELLPTITQVIQRATAAAAQLG